MKNDSPVKAGSFRSKKSILLFIDVIAIVLSFVFALAIRFRVLVASLGSYLVVATYIPFFIAVLIAYIVTMLDRTEMWNGKNLLSRILPDEKDGVAE